MKTNFEIAYDKGYESNKNGDSNPYKFHTNMWARFEQGLRDARNEQDECVKCGSPLGISGECNCNND